MAILNKDWEGSQFSENPGATVDVELLDWLDARSVKVSLDILVVASSQCHFGSYLWPVLALYLRFLLFVFAGDDGHSGHSDNETV